MKGKYHSIQQRHVILSSCHIIEQNSILQQDNDSKRFYVLMKKLCSNYIKSKEDKRIQQIITWPLQSPHLSPIEPVQDEIDHKVRSELPKNKQELFTYLHTAWESLPPT